MDTPIAEASFPFVDDIMNAIPAPDRPSPDEPVRIVGAGLDFSAPDSPLAPYYLRASHVAAVGMCAVVFLLLCFVPLWHTDIWGHLKFGEWIVAHGELAESDPLCPFADPASTPHHGWLSQVIFYAIFHAGELLAGGDRLQRLAGGVDLLRLSHALIVTLRCVVLLVAFRRVSGSLPAACWTLAAMLVLSLGNIAILRPQVLGELFFAVVLLALSRPGLSVRAMIGLPLLLVIWANVHGSFGTGLVLLTGYALGNAVEAGWSAPHGKLAAVLRDGQCRRLFLVLIASGLAIACCNPSGPHIYMDVLAMAAQPNVRAMDEWQPLRFQWSGGGHWTYLVLLVWLAVTQIRAARWFSPTTLLLIAIFAVQPLLHQRMLIWWLMVAPWLIVQYWPAHKPGWFARWTQFESVPSFRKTLLAGALIVLAGVWSIPGQWLAAGHPGNLDRTLSAGTPLHLTTLLLEPGREPAPELAKLEKALREKYPHQQFSGRIFVSETLGDFFLWELAPDAPILVYSHVHLFTPEHWREVMAVRFGQPSWRMILDRHGVNLVVVEPERNPRLCSLLRQDKDWLVVLDETGLARKPDPRNQHFIALRVSPIRAK